MVGSLVCREAVAIPRRRLAEGLSIEQIQTLSDDLPPITMQDICDAAASTKPTVTRETIQRHENWKKKFGSEI